MRILILGGTQFVGKAVAKYFIKQGHFVSILTRGVLPVDYDGLTHHFIGDRNTATGIKIIKNTIFDVIVDISAYSANHIINVLDKGDIVPSARYIMCSSGAVYLPSMDFLREDSQTGKNPLWGNYGINKLNAENALIKYSQLLGFDFTIFRPSYIYGPENNLQRETRLFRDLERNELIRYPDSKNRVQFIYIDDFVKLIDSAIYSNQSRNQIYNATNIESVDWYEWIMTISSVLKCTPNLSPKKLHFAEEAKLFFPFRDYQYLLENKKCKCDGLYIPQTPLMTGIEAAYNWFQKNR